MNEMTTAERAERCRCGHTRGNHRWFSVGGRRPCYEETDGTRCACGRFVPTAETPIAVGAAGAAPPDALAFEAWFDGEFARVNEAENGISACTAMIAEDYRARDIREDMRLAWNSAVNATLKHCNLDDFGRAGAAPPDPSCRYKAFAEGFVAVCEVHGGTAGRCNFVAASAPVGQALPDRDANDEKRVVWLDEKIKDARDEYLIAARTYSKPFADATAGKDLDNLLAIRAFLAARQAPETGEEFVALIRDETNERYPNLGTVESDRLRGAYQQGFTRAYFFTHSTTRQALPDREILRQSARNLLRSRPFSEPHARGTPCATCDAREEAVIDFVLAALRERGMG
jgi:hypothetical protein